MKYICLMVIVVALGAAAVSAQTKSVSAPTSQDSGPTAPPTDGNPTGPPR